MYIERTHKGKNVVLWMKENQNKHVLKLARTHYRNRGKNTPSCFMDEGKAD